MDEHRPGRPPARHPLQHEHDYLDVGHAHGERRTRYVVALTAAMMVVELIAGTVFGSMALLADGWHMASHASALGITAFAYAHARRHLSNRRYTFGTWKVGVLGGFSSAVVLAVIAVLIAWESIGRLRQPLVISFDEAIAVAVLGLVVNLASAFLLRGHPESGHEKDHNLRAAYLHVLADAVTSLTAIVALTTGKYLGWVWMDPAMGIVGSLVIGRWSYGLLRATSRILLDADVEVAVTESIRQAVEGVPDTQVVDLHVWRVGPDDLAVILVVATSSPREPGFYRDLVRTIVAPTPLGLTHVTIEVNA